MTPEEAKEFSEAWGQQGGSWRHAALPANLGIPEALGLSLDEWIKKYCGGHIKMVAEKRREAALELSKDGFSNRKIAKVLGVDKNTINNDMTEFQSPHLKSLSEADDEVTVSVAAYCGV
jgi:Homeodomain-like domain-containing protein